MPTEREWREQMASWNADGRPSLLNNLRGCGGCLWFVLAVLCILIGLVHLASRAGL
jgi:hypothetical protein